MTNTTTCPSCSNEYQSLGRHLTGDCTVTPDSDLQELLDGLIIGDGTIGNGGSGNYRLTVTTTEYEYALHLRDILGWIFKKIQHIPFDYKKDQYHVRTICHDYFTKQRERWYPEGTKKIPDDFEVTPTTMKHWVCADGNFSSTTGGKRYKIGNSMEQNRREWIEQLFPFPATYIGYEICFKVSDTDDIKEYMGNPPPGFEYKWEE